MEPDFKVVKPPVGLIPKWLWLEHRRDEIYAAIKRYVEHESKPLIPSEWCTELIDLNNQIEKEAANKESFIYKQHNEY